MTHATVQKNRLASYSTVATAAAASAISGGHLRADTFVSADNLDITLQSFDDIWYFGNFDYTNTQGTRASVNLQLGGLDLQFTGFVSDVRDRGWEMQVGDGANQANFKQQIGPLPSAGPQYVSFASFVDSGATWGSSTLFDSPSLKNQMFYQYGTLGGGSRTFSQSFDSGTKFVLFHMDATAGSDEKWGWVKFTASPYEPGDEWDFGYYRMYLDQWAWSDEGPLAAGATSVPAVPGLGGLAALAVGAAGVRGRRQRMAD